MDTTPAVSTSKEARTLKATEKPKVGMWVRESHYGLWLGQLKYRAGNGQWLVCWRCRYYRPSYASSWMMQEKWGLHARSRIRKMRVITRAEAYGELTLLQLAR